MGVVLMYRKKGENKINEDVQEIGWLKTTANNIAILI